MSCFTRFRNRAPLLTTAVGVGTLGTCLIITKVKGVYVSGLTWPFFSDTGRDAPAYYVFSVGLSLLAVLLSCTWGFNYQFQRAALHSGSTKLSAIRSTWLHRLAVAVCICGIVSTIGLPVLAIFDISGHTHVHLLGAYWFFAWEVLAVFLNVYISKQLLAVAEQTDEAQDGSYQHLDDETGKKNSVAERPFNAQHSVHKRRRTFRIQCVFALIFVIGFLFYIPVGHLLGGTMRRLTISECLDLDLGDTYCTETKRRNATLTVLFKAGDNFASVQLMACSQLVCVLTLMAYSMSFLAHDYDETRAAETLEQDAV